MQVPKTLTPADIAAIEKEIGSTREEREKHAMDMALNAGLRGSLMVGGAGVVGHMLAQKFCKCQLRRIPQSAGGLQAAPRPTRFALARFHRAMVQDRHLCAGQGLHRVQHVCGAWQQRSRCRRRSSTSAPRQAQAGYWIWSESTMTQQMRFLNNLESVKQDMADAETYDRLGRALPGKR